MLISFSFAFDTESKTGTFSGNVNGVTALQILQSLVIARQVKDSMEAEKAKDLKEVAKIVSRKKEAVPVD